jgi:hypothetical protein
VKRALPLGAAVAVVLGLWWFTSSTPTAREDGATPAVKAPAPGRVTPRRASDDDETIELARRHPGAPAPTEPAPQVDGGLDAGSAGEHSSSGSTVKLASLEPEVVRDFLKKNAADAAKYVDRFCEENKRLSGVRGYGESPKHRDAAVYLGTRVDWEGGRVGLLHLPASIVQRMQTPPRNWVNFTNADYAGLDFGWFKDLLEFDTWSLSGDGPLKDADSLSFYEAPLPNFVTLQNWAKLRLIKGKNENDLPQASLEVRHLGDLIASNGTLLSEMIRAAFYGIERGVWDAAGLVAPEPVPSADDVQRIRQSSFSSIFFLYPGVAKEVREKALACTPARCSAITEAVGMAAAMRGLEPGAADDLDWLRSQPGCDQALAERIARGTKTLHPDALPTSNDLAHWMRLLTDGGVE